MSEGRERKRKRERERERERGVKVKEGKGHLRYTDRHKEGKEGEKGVR